MNSLSSSYILLVALLITTGVNSAAAFFAPIKSTPARHHHLFASERGDAKADVGCNESASSPFAVNTRRKWFRSIASPAAASLPYLLSSERASAAAAAAASADEKCDPGDVICRQKKYDRFMDSFQEESDAPPSTVQPIPAVTNRITYVVQMIIDIGERRDGNAGYIRFGLYGNDCPGSVKQMLLFLTRGISSMDRAALEDRLEVDSMPVSLGDGNGSVQNICSGTGIDFGVPSQSKAYSKSRGMRTAGPYFVPQNRPVPTLEGEAFPRPHSVAGLISVPAKGIGYSAASSNSDLDEIYSSAFTITGGPVPALDKAQQQYRVIGQIIDDESMQFLDRLANLPLQKKLGKSGLTPPLLKVRVRDVDVQKVK
mmetsp:Transcript_44637/g.93674  ORF Transcript_44637/g.93674 Transcript_44637/m.93674 type:complete len:370 (-) Transcript_44637:162-1271(-)